MTVGPNAPPNDATWPVRRAPMNPCATKAESAPTIPGFPFLHAGMSATISGPTGGGRSMLIESCCYDAAKAGVRVLYLGDEITEPEWNARAATIAHLRNDKANESLCAKLAACDYMDLPEAIAHAWKKPDAWQAVCGEYRVVVIDPVSSVASTLGKNFVKEGSDYLEYYAKLIRPLTMDNEAVVQLDNIGHDEKNAKRSHGVAEKGHRADLTFWCKKIVSPRGLALVAEKVRSVRCAHRRGDKWEIYSSDQRLARVDVRPVDVMRRIMLALKFGPMQNTSEVRAAGECQQQTANAALALLIEEGYVENTDGYSWLKDFEE